MITSPPLTMHSSSQSILKANFGWKIGEVWNRRGFSHHLVNSERFWSHARLQPIQRRWLLAPGHVSDARLAWPRHRLHKWIQRPHCAATKRSVGKFSYLMAPWPRISNPQPQVNTTLRRCSHQKHDTSATNNSHAVPQPRPATAAESATRVNALSLSSVWRSYLRLISGPFNC